MSRSRPDLSPIPSPAVVRRIREDYQEGTPLKVLASRLGRGLKFVEEICADLRAEKAAKRRARATSGVRRNRAGNLLDVHGKEFIAAVFPVPSGGLCAACLSEGPTWTVSVKRKVLGYFELRAVYQLCHSCREDVAGAMAKVERRCEP